MMGTGLAGDLVAGQLTLEGARRREHQKVHVELAGGTGGRERLHDLADAALGDAQLDFPALGLVADAQQGLRRPHLAVGERLAEVPVQQRARQRRLQPEVAGREASALVRSRKARSSQNLRSRSASF